MKSLQTGFRFSSLSDNFPFLNASSRRRCRVARVWKLQFSFSFFLSASAQNPLFTLPLCITKEPMKRNENRSRRSIMQHKNELQLFSLVDSTLEAPLNRTRRNYEMSRNRKCSSRSKLVSSKVRTANKLEFFTSINVAFNKFFFFKSNSQVLFCRVGTE